MIARLYSTVYIMDGPVHFVDIRIQSAGLAFLGVFTRSARISLGKEEVRCNGRKLFDGVQWVRLPPGKG